MPSKNKVSVTARISADEYDRLEVIANAQNISISALLKLFVNAILNGDIEVKKGELKLGVDPIGYAVSDEDFEENLKFKEYRMDKLLNTFQELGYPDYLIRQSIETMICQLKETGKYSTRRSSVDWGC